MEPGAAPVAPAVPVATSVPAAKAPALATADDAQRPPWE
jgi:hypothetical protein